MTVPDEAKSLMPLAEGDVPDLVREGLDVLFCGINPGLVSGATGHHFARPGNRFWKAIHLGGLTDRVLEPGEGDALLRAGVGITNLVPRTTASAAELDKAELIAGADRLRRVVAAYRPKVVAVLGLGAYRAAFDKKATLGRQPGAPTGVATFVLPNPSGLQARYQLPALASMVAEVRAAALELG